MHLITAAAAPGHITSVNMGILQSMYYGDGNHVFKGYGKEFGYEMPNKTKFRLLSGQGLMNGRHFEIKDGDVEEIDIQNGTANSYRRDLITVRYIKSQADTGYEVAEPTYIKGISAESQSEVVDPDYYHDTLINDGADFYDYVLYSIDWAGTTPTVNARFTPEDSVGKEVLNAIADIDAYKQQTTAKVNELENTLRHLQQVPKVMQIRQQLQPRRQNHILTTHLNMYHRMCRA